MEPALRYNSLAAISQLGPCEPTWSTRWTGGTRGGALGSLRASNFAQLLEGLILAWRDHRAMCSDTKETWLVRRALYRAQRAKLLHLQRRNAQAPENLLGMLAHHRPAAWDYRRGT
jgi:hypothetical protein